MWKLYVLITYTLEFQRFSCIDGTLLDFKCPHKSQWSKRANVICELAPEMYHCLNDTNSKTPTEKCIQPDDLPPGFKSVFTGNRNAEKCSLERFSPLMSWTNDGFECEYKKSVCLEEGQIMHDIGTITRDTACRCDYTRGYNFATAPTKDCFCYPSQEDCTCYIKRCSDPRYSLTSDYTCLGEHQVLNYTKCSRISIKPPNTYIRESATFFDDEFTSRAQDIRFIILILWLTIVVSVVCLVMLLITYNFPEASKDLILPTSIDKIQSTLKQHSVVILKGRKGTGKNTLASYLSCSYANSVYLLEEIVITRDNFTISPKVRCYHKCLVLFENISQFSTDWEQILTNVEKIFTVVRNVRRDAKFIITVEYLFEEFVEFLENKVNVKLLDVKFDLDEENFYSIDAKKDMFCFHLDKAEHNESVSPEKINKILDVCKNPVYGFPLICKWFCSKKDHIDQGVQFFEQPPLEFVQKIENIREDGESCPANAKLYCLLVLVMLFKREVDNCQKILLEFWSMQRLIYPKGSNYKDMNVDALLALVGRNWEFFVLKKKQIAFVRSDICNAVMISLAKVHIKIVLQQCNVTDILPFMRPDTYKALEGEVVLYIGGNHYSYFAKRLAKESVENSYLAGKIKNHLAKFKTLYHDTSLSERFDIELETTKQ